MKRICFWVLVILVSASGCLMAQDVPKVEIFGGYSYARADTNGEGSLNMNGWNGSLNGVLGKWIGMAVDFSQVWGTFETPPIHTQVRSFLFGPQFTFRKHEKVVPFVHGLIGVSRSNQSIDVPVISQHMNSFAFMAGGGIDVPLRPRVAIRVVQADYFMTRFDSERQDNFRLSFGVVFQIGQK